MIEFHIRLLKGRVRVAVEDVCSTVALRVKLQRLGVRELGTIVAEDNREEPFKQVGTEPSVQIVEAVDDGLGSVALSREREHEIAVFKEHGEHDLAADAPDDGVHFDNGATGIPDKPQELCIGTPYTAG